MIWNGEELNDIEKILTLTFDSGISPVEHLTLIALPASKT